MLCTAAPLAVHAFSCPLYGFMALCIQDWVTPMKPLVHRSRAKSTRGIYFFLDSKDRKSYKHETTEKRHVSHLKNSMYGCLSTIFPEAIQR